ADDQRGNAEDAELGGLLGRLAERALDAVRSGGLLDSPRVQLAGGGGDQDVVGLGQVAAGGERLAESGEGEGDGAAGLLGKGRRPHREQGVGGGGGGPDEGAAPVPP